MLQTYFLVRTLKNKAQFCDYKSQKRTGVKRMQSCKRKNHHSTCLHCKERADVSPSWEDISWIYITCWSAVQNPSIAAEYQSASQYSLSDWSAVLHCSILGMLFPEHKVVSLYNTWCLYTSLCKTAEVEKDKT